FSWAGTRRATTAPRSVMSICSPRLTRASTPAVFWFSSRTGTSDMLAIVLRICSTQVQRRVSAEPFADLPPHWYQQASHRGGVRRLGTLVAEKSLGDGHFA